MIIFFFDAGVVFFVILLLFLVFARGAASLVLSCLVFVCILFAIRSIIGNLYFGAYKNKANPALCLLSTLIDIGRESLFYYLIKTYAFDTWHSYGLSVITSSIDFFIVCIFGGFLFIMSEAYSSIISIKSEESAIGVYVGWNIVGTVLFALFALWALY